MASLAAGGDLNKKCTVGLLMDKESVCFSFSMLSLDNMLPLPLTLVSPAVKWRTGTAVHRGPCVAMCLTQQFPLERIMVDEGLWGGGDG